MSKEMISDIWGFDDPIDEKKSEPPTNSCPNILCVMGKCTESSMQIKEIFPVRTFHFSRNYRWLDGHSKEFLYEVSLAV